jgi:hypothetical protein
MMAGGGESMMMLAGEGDPEAMADSTMKETAPVDPRAVLREQIREKLKGLSKEERQAKMKVFREGKAAERKALLAELGLEAPPTFDPLDDMFESLTFTTASGCVEIVAGKLLDAPLSAEQQSTLLAVLATPALDSPFTPEELDDQKRKELLHLITSMAEYQLC